MAVLPLLWADAVSDDGMYILGHLLMLPAMLAIMLRGQHEPALA